jgi:hypothetical protein
VPAAIARAVFFYLRRSPKGGRPGRSQISGDVEEGPGGSADPAGAQHPSLEDLFVWFMEVGDAHR